MGDLPLTGGSSILYVVVVVFSLRNLLLCVGVDVAFEPRPLSCDLKAFLFSCVASAECPSFLCGAGAASSASPFLFLRYKTRYFLGFVV